MYNISCKMKYILFILVIFSFKALVALSISGVVYDQSTNTPLSQVLVMTEMPTGGLQISMSDQNGNYSLDQLVPGTYLINATNNLGNYLPYTDSIELNSNLTYDIYLIPSGIPTDSSLGGTVTSSLTGQPIIDAGVFIVCEEPGIDFSTSTLTDMNGIYLLDSIPDGLYTIHVNDIELFYEVYSAEVTVNDDTTHDVVMVPEGGTGFILEGNIQESDGTNLANVPISLAGVDNNYFVQTISDDAGNYLFDNLEQGSYTLVVTQDGEEIYNYTLQINQDMTWDIVIGVVENEVFEWIVADPETLYLENDINSSNISVRLVDDLGYPIEDVTVFFQTDLGMITSSSMTDANGVAQVTFWISTTPGVANISASTGINTISTQVTILNPVSNSTDAINNTLLSNYPNPFNPETTISYSMKEAGAVRIDIFNINGQIVKTLVNENKSVGNHKVVWNGEDEANNRCASGLYFYKMKSGSYSKTNKMILMK